MTKVNVNSALKRDDIRAVLESQESPKYTFVKMTGPMEMQFEVEDDGTHGDLANYTKGLIKKQPWGAALFMRVLIDGQAFTGQKI